MGWWRRRGSNPRPSHCERDALPTELLPPKMARNLSSKGARSQSIAQRRVEGKLGYRAEGTNMIKTDERAPEFTLPDEAGKDRSLTELLRAGAIVLYFYPADFTPGCTRQACVLRDLHTEIERANLRVVGISPQSPESHTKFKAKYQLPFVRLSDQQKPVIKMYPVNGPLGFGLRRAIILVDSSRRVRDVVLADFRIGRHSDFVRKAVMLRATA